MNVDNLFDQKTITSYYYQGYGNMLFHVQPDNIASAGHVLLLGHPQLLPHGQRESAWRRTPWRTRPESTRSERRSGPYGGTLWDNPYWKVDDQYQGRRQIRLQRKFTF